MFEFTSKPIAISDSMILCQDGTIYNNKFQIIAHTKKTKEKTSPESHYCSDFINTWEMWCRHIKNPSNKRNSYLAWKKLKDSEKTEMILSIEQYSKSNSDHNYLKRCETYINQKHWENIDIINVISKNTIPTITDVIWDKKIYNQDTGITDKARDQVERFGMSKEEAWRLINDL